MAVGEARVPILTEQRSPHVLHNDSQPKSEVRKLTHADLPRSTTVVTSLVAGAVAGALAKSAIAPLDRTKINFQASQVPYSWKAAMTFLTHCLRTEGVLALWRGNSATMARIVPYAAIQFTAHEQCKRALKVDDPVLARQHPIRLLVAGSLAGVISQSATYPLDMARARMAVTQASEYRTLQSMFRKVIAEEGLRTLYRGYPATVLGVIPYAGVSFFTYDTLKHIYIDKFGASSPAASIVCGGAAGALAQSASYPLDIVRRRMQTAKRRADGSYPYRNAWTTLREVYGTEGVRGFYKGLSMNWVKGPIAVGISFATYDTIRSSLRDVAVGLKMK